MTEAIRSAQNIGELCFYIINSDASEPRLGSDLGLARAIFQKARIEKIVKNEPIWGLLKSII